VEGNDNVSNGPDVIEVQTDDLCGAECFSLYIRNTKLPRGLKNIEGLTKFNGQQDPKMWINDYGTIIKVVGGTRNNAMQLLSLHLKDSARLWLNNLPPASIRSWGELREVFVHNFRGTSKRATSFEVLRLCIQKEGETLRFYISRWLNLRNSTEVISNERGNRRFS
jgi:hypothetical protein